MQSASSFQRPSDFNALAADFHVFPHSYARARRDEVVGSTARDRIEAEIDRLATSGRESRSPHQRPGNREKMRSIENGGTNTTSFGTDRRAGILCAPVPRESDVTPFCEIPKQGKDHDSGCEKQARLRPPSVSGRIGEGRRFILFPTFASSAKRSTRVGKSAPSALYQNCKVVQLRSPGSRHIEG